jgi:hypothetical protein
MKKITFNGLILIISLIAWTSCQNDDNDTTPNPSSNIIEITANIEIVTTWVTGKIYVIKKWDFYVDNTLTIQPGVIIKFHPTLGPFLTLGGSGTIVANGTADKPVIFTSYKDDASGGDTNGDGTSTTPARGDWGMISLNGLNGSVFSYCTFMYSGINQYAALDLAAGSSASVNHCTFSHNDGLYHQGALSAANSGTATLIQDNVFYDNVVPLSISTIYSLDNSNTFHNPADIAQTNTWNAIFVESINDILTPVSWLEDEVAFVIDDNDCWIEATLTLGDNVVIKFKPSSVIVLNNGNNPIVNYNGTGVYFTSFKDDTKKGDSNADGSATSPSDGDWEGIYNNVSSSYEIWGNILYDNQ